MNNLFSKNINKTKNTKISLHNNIKQEEQNFWLLYNFEKHLLQRKTLNYKKNRKLIFHKIQF